MTLRFVSSSGKLLLLVTAGCLSFRGGLAQCNPGQTYYYYTDTVTRPAPNLVYLYTALYPSGGDAASSSYSITASATFNGAALGNPLTAYASYGGTAYSTRTITIATTQNYGNYVNNIQARAVDNCTGQVSPPFTTGITSGAATANLNVIAPAISGNSDIYLNSYDPNQTQKFYPSDVTYSAILNGATGTPHWTLTGNNAAYLNIGCTDCVSTSLTPRLPTAVASCSTAAILEYSVGGAPSVQLGIMIRDGHQVVATSPTTGQHVDNIPDTGIYSGYSSLFYWQDVDSCGAQMSSAGGFEQFPNGFHFDLSGTLYWGLPSANTWTTGSDGGWFDRIGESCYNVRIASGPSIVNPPKTCFPLPQSPQTPLGPTLVYDGLQNVYLGRPHTTGSQKLVFSGQQGHWLDHGGYVGQTTLYP